MSDELKGSEGLKGTDKLGLRLEQGVSWRLWWALLFGKKIVCEMIIPITAEVKEGKIVFGYGAGQLKTQVL